MMILSILIGLLIILLCLYSLICGKPRRGLNKLKDRKFGYGISWGEEG